MKVDIHRRMALLLDSYLAVTSLYSEQIALAPAPGESRLQRLLDSLEAKTPESRTGFDLTEVGPDAARGQNIAPTRETLDALSTYCAEILERLEQSRGTYRPRKPRNIDDLKALLQGDRQDLIVHFGSLTLTMDRLVDLSRITVLPEPNDLLRRDLQYMLVTEFELFIQRLLVLAKFQEPHNTEIKADALLQDLMTAFDSGDGVDLMTELVAASLPGDPLQQLGQLENLCDRYFPPMVKPETLAADLTRYWGNPVSERARVRQLLASKRRYLSPHPLDYDVPSVDDLLRDADLLTLYGIRLAAVLWLNVSSSVSLKGDVFKRFIYVTRILLDEGKWLRARRIAEMSVALRKTHNQAVGLPEFDGVPMFVCNAWWSAVKMNEDIAEDVAAWDTTDLHTRYKFLQAVLLEKYEEALRHLNDLLVPEKDTGIPNMHMTEVEEWPILERLRDTEAFKKWNTERANKKP